MLFSVQRAAGVLSGLLVLACAGCTSSSVSTDGPLRILYNTRPTYVEEGTASWYGGRDIGRKTANGEVYRSGDVTAAHKKLPFNTMVRVTNLRNGKTTIVRINDRGPYIRGRIVDLSEAAAKKIGLYDAGLAKVRLEVFKPIPIMERPNLRLKDTGTSKKHKSSNQ